MYTFIYTSTYKHTFPIMSTPCRRGFPRETWRLALDLGIGEDEGHGFALDTRADAQSLQVFEESVVVVGLRNGDPQPTSLGDRWRNG